MTAGMFPGLVPNDKIDHIRGHGIRPPGLRRLERETDRRHCIREAEVRMKAGYEAALSDYQAFAFTDGPWTRPVYRRGSGPAVIVVHEIPGLHPMMVRFADRIVAAGMTVFLPVLFGEPGRPVTNAYAIRSMVSNICVRREFNAWSAGRSSPIVAWRSSIQANS